MKSIFALLLLASSALAQDTGYFQREYDSVIAKLVRIPASDMKFENDTFAALWEREISIRNFITSGLPNHLKKFSCYVDSLNKSFEPSAEKRKLIDSLYPERPVHIVNLKEPKRTFERYILWLIEYGLDSDNAIARWRFGRKNS